MGKGCKYNDVEISHYCVEDNEKSFANIIGCIENILISEIFTGIQNNFLETYYKEFEDDDENKLIYTDIFRDYLETVEKHIENELIKQIPGFQMKNLEILLEERSGELEGEIFEMLSSFWNFNIFKEMVLEYKRMKEGKAIDFSQDILIKKCDAKEFSI
ncbi:ADP-ribosylation factor-like protein 2-binding protein isoform X2 [Rhynchophorus ferrugineus]